MKFSGVLLFLIIFLAVPATVCHGHGTACRLFDGVAGIEASYDDGRPMAFCDVTVYFPAGEKKIYLAGETDANGRFIFIPDASGRFRVAVDDGMGHVTAIEFEFNDGSVAGKPGSIKGESGGGCFFIGLDRTSAVITGISVIFGLFGLVSLFHRRRLKEARASLADKDNKGER